MLYRDIRAIDKVYTHIMTTHGIATSVTLKINNNFRIVSKDIFDKYFVQDKCLYETFPSLIGRAVVLKGNGMIGYIHDIIAENFFIDYYIVLENNRHQFHVRNDFDFLEDDE